MRKGILLTHTPHTSTWTRSPRNRSLTMLTERACLLRKLRSGSPLTCLMTTKCEIKHLCALQSWDLLAFMSMFYIIYFFYICFCFWKFFTFLDSIFVSPRVNHYFYVNANKFVRSCYQWKVS